MKENSTQPSQQMDTVTINRRNVSRGPKPEIIMSLRSFARAYFPFKETPLPGIILN